MANKQRICVVVNASAKVQPKLEEVLARIQRIVGVENDHQLARKVGIAQTTISTWRKRGKIPYDFCLSIAQDYDRSIDWVLFGSLRSFDISTMEYGFIVLDLYGVCWAAAEKVTAIAPDLDVRLVAALIYNGRLKHFVNLMERKLSLEQAIFAFSVADDVGSTDFAKYAEVLRLEIRNLECLTDVFEDGAQASAAENPESQDQVISSKDQ